MRRNSAVLTSCVLGAILALALPGGALAGPALDQYIETIPGAGGDKPSKADGGGGGSSSVPEPELEALQASGDDGVATAAAVAATAPRVSDEGSEKGKDKGNGSAGEDDGSAFLLEENGKAPIPAVLSTVAGGGSGGIALPVVLLAVLLVGLALAARGRRNSTGR